MQGPSLCDIPGCCAFATLNLGGLGGKYRYPLRCWKHEHFAPWPVELPPFEQCEFEALLEGKCDQKPGHDGPCTPFRESIFRCRLMRGHQGGCR